MNKDWTGNNKSVFVTVGSSAHSEKERAKNDYYATDPKAMELLLEYEDLQNVWEVACGEGHLAKVLEREGRLQLATDLIDRGYGMGGVDFLNLPDNLSWSIRTEIVTNPPYKYAKEFVEKALSIVGNGYRVAMFLKLTFLEAKSRKELFQKYPPKVVYVSSSRLKCAPNGDFDSIDSSATAYAWFVWEKGYTGNTILKWIN